MFFLDYSVSEKILRGNVLIEHPRGLYCLVKLSDLRHDILDYSEREIKNSRFYIVKTNEFGKTLYLKEKGFKFKDSISDKWKYDSIGKIVSLKTFKKFKAIGGGYATFTHYNI